MISFWNIGLDKPDLDDLTKSGDEKVRGAWEPLFWQQWSLRWLVAVIKVDIFLLILNDIMWSKFVFEEDAVTLEHASLTLKHVDLGWQNKATARFLQKEGIKVFCIFLSWHSNNFCRNIQALDEEIFEQGCCVWSAD